MHLILQYRDINCRSNFLPYPVTVYWHRANQSQHWPCNARPLAGYPLECQCWSHWYDSTWKNPGACGNWTPDLSLLRQRHIHEAKEAVAESTNLYGVWVLVRQAVGWASHRVNQPLCGYWWDRLWAEHPTESTNLYVCVGIGETGCGLNIPQS